MFGMDILIQKVLLLIIMAAVGFILSRFNKAGPNISKGLADIVVYAAQPALIIYLFVDADFSSEILLTSACVFIFSMIFHLMFCAVSMLLYKNRPEKQRVILRFATIFTNAGFMGIPLISELMGSAAAIYASFYVVSFNIFCWSFGCYLYTGDRKYISVKKMLINPATVPTYIGLALFIAGGFLKIPSWLGPVFEEFLIPVVKNDVLFMLKTLVLPLSMLMIGIRLAQSRISEIFKDWNLPLFVAVRLVLLPVIIIFIMKLVMLTGLIPDGIIRTASAVLVICASTPASSTTNIFAEMFDSDAAYASRLVSSTTVISAVTMPAISMLMFQII